MKLTYFTKEKKYYRSNTLLISQNYEYFWKGQKVSLLSPMLTIEAIQREEIGRNESSKTQD